MLISNIRNFAVRLVVSLTAISLLPLLGAQASPVLPHSGPELQAALSDRYIIFIDGVDSHNLGATPLKHFEFIKNKLIKAGIANKHFVYFSYSATAKTNYCLGWKDACTPAQDLSYVNLFPIYGVIHTHLKITHQAETLKWLIGQIVKKDPSAKIDIIGFSQGGIIAAYLGSKLDSSSPLYPHIHGIIAIESPLSGIPGASPCLDNPDHAPLCLLISAVWGKELLTALQIPDTLPGSIVDDLPNVAENFRFTSIQSTSDYAVNGELFRIHWPNYGPQEVLIGIGSQGWPRYKQKFYGEEQLGGNDLTEDYVFWPFASSWIQTNHSAPLENEKTAAWIIEAINVTTEVPPDVPPEEQPGEPPSIPWGSWEELKQQFSNWWQQLQEDTKDGLDKWWQEQQKKMAEALDQWWQDIQKQFVEWFWQQYMELLSQCFGSAFLPIGALAGIWIYRRKKGTVLK